MSKYLSVPGLAISSLILFIVAGVLWGVSLTEKRTEQAIRNNFTAAGLLSRLQVEGEKMRRYEKEMFIYVAEADKRAGYVKEFDGAYGKMLSLLDTMLAPSGTAFTALERGELMKWKEASVFYTGEFAKLAREAERINAATLTPEQRASVTVEFNSKIKAGKDRFRELLSGTDKLRTLKEEQSIAMAGEINGIFNQLRWGLLIGGVLAIASILFSHRRSPRKTV